MYGLGFIKSLPIMENHIETEVQAGGHRRGVWVRMSGPK